MRRGLHALVACGWMLAGCRTAEPTTAEAPAAATPVASEAPPAAAPSGLAPPAAVPLADARFGELVRDGLELDPETVARIDAQGLVISARHARPTYTVAYADVFRRDLPVWITVDTLLYALHRNVDEVLPVVERTQMIPRLSALLARWQEGLDVCGNRTVYDRALP